MMREGKGDMGEVVSGEWLVASEESKRREEFPPFPQRARKGWGTRKRIFVRDRILPSMSEENPRPTCKREAVTSGEWLVASEEAIAFAK
jgi:hypothetical protein